MVFGEYGVIFHRELPDLRWHEMIRLGPDSCGQRWRRKMHTYLEQKGFAGEALEVEYERRLRTNKLHDFLLHVGV